jgi:Ran-binding protein 1
LQILFTLATSNMSAAEIDAEGDANEKLVEEDVDVSQLKIAAFAGWAPGSEVKSGEEEEEPLYTDRARLYVRTEGEWKERGVGEVKLLKHKETGYVRIILRQDKTLKLRLNHKVQPAATLAPNAGNDKSWVFTAQDFAEEKLETHSFALKFKDAGESFRRCNRFLALERTTWPFIPSFSPSTYFDADVAKAFQKAYDGARDSNKKLIEAGVTGKAAAVASPAKAAAPAAGAGSAAAAPSPAKAAEAAPAPAPAAAAAAPTPKKEEVAVTDSASSADALVSGIAKLDVGKEEELREI